MIKVGFDAGHGLGTPGKCTPDREREWTFNDKVARAFANELSLYQGVSSKRFDDPTGKRDVPLIERTNGANAWGANYYISFHHNANTAQWGNWTGVETFIYTTPNSKSIALANAIHPALVKGYGVRDRSVKKGNLHIVREMQKSGAGVVLVEGGFMDSTIDIKKLRDDEVLENAGRMIAQAFAKFCGLKKVSVSKKEEKEVAQLLNETGRKEARELIKRACKEGVFDASYHTNERIAKYNDGELISYHIAYTNRVVKP